MIKLRNRLQLVVPKLYGLRLPGEPVDYLSLLLNDVFIHVVNLMRSLIGVENRCGELRGVGDIVLVKGAQHRTLVKALDVRDLV